MVKFPRRRRSLTFCTRAFTMRCFGLLFTGLFCNFVCLILIFILCQQHMLAYYFVAHSNKSTANYRRQSGIRIYEYNREYHFRDEFYLKKPSRGTKNRRISNIWSYIVIMMTALCKLGIFCHEPSKNSNVFGKGLLRG